MRKLYSKFFLMGALMLALGSAHAATGKGEAKHEGVASCAGGTCHGATAPLGDHGIRQDEYFIWQKQDVHGKAYLALAGEKSRQIGLRMGLDPLRASSCLSCHTETVPEHLRGERFLSSDGIGCEACHGPAGHWLAEHTKPGISLAEKESIGMRPTWKPQVRAQLCLSCHQGDAQHPITHAMMAAGHPPILFELDTFTTLQPPHYDRDADYAKRKGVQNPSRDWALGQVTAAQQFLQGISSGRLGSAMFPELMNFDCAACHHSMTAGRVTPGRTGAMPGGTVPLADTQLHWVGLWLQVMAPQTAEQWQKSWLALQSASGQSPAAVRAAASRMLGLLNGGVMPLALSQSPNTAQLQRLLDSIGALGRSSRAGDFATAQQAAMASVVMVNSLQASGAGGDAATRKAIDALYASVKSPDSFVMADYHRALASVAAAAHGSN